MNVVTFVKLTSHFEEIFCSEVNSAPAGALVAASKGKVAWCAGSISRNEESGERTFLRKWSR